MKKVVSILLVLVMAFGLLAGCSSGSQASASPSPSAAASASPTAKTSGFKIGMCTANFGNTWCAQFVSDFEKRADEYKAEGILADYQVATVSADLTDQINQCNAMINSGIDALLIWCVSPTGVKPIVDLALENNVMVIISNENAAYEGTYSIIGNNYGFQDILTKWLAAQLPNGGNIVSITGVDGFDANTVRQQAVSDVLSKSPNIKTLASAPGNWSTTTAQSVMSTFLSTYGNKIDGVLTQDVMADGILKAYENANVKPKLMTGDYTKSYLKSWAALPDLKSISVTYDPGIIVTCLDVAVNLLAGKTFKDGMLEPNPLDSSLVNTVTVNPGFVVTKEGDSTASWMQGYTGTKAITLDKALDMLKDSEDTAALDGYLSRDEVNAWFK